MKSVLTLVITSLFALSGCSSDDPPVGYELVDLGHGSVSDPGPGPIEDTTQVVYLSFLDDFEPALDLYGLRGASETVKASIRMHLRQNLAAYDFAVLIDPSELSVAHPDQVLTLDVRGDDPNGLQLLAIGSGGLKDVGNHIKNEHVGKADGVGIVGGLFVSELLEVFGQDPGTRDPQFPIVFGPVAPAFGGEPVAQFPGSRNDALIGQVISVLGALLAETATKIIGQEVGLPANLGTDVFSNEGANGCFLDAGPNRSFEERARLNGQSLRFCPENDAYLQSVLPLPER